MTYTYTVVLQKEPEGGYTVLVPALSGCITYGNTVPEALTMAKEAMECYIESLLQHGEPVPAEGPTLCLETEGLSEGFFFRVTAVPDGDELPAVAYEPAALTERDGCGPEARGVHRRQAEGRSPHDAPPRNAPQDGGPHAPGRSGRGHLHAIIRQAGLTDDEFAALV